MTSNSAFKKIVRDHAASHGVPYTEARRRVLTQMSDLIDAAASMGADEPIRVTVHGLHYATDDHGRLPKPFFIHRNGTVRRQDHWRGDPYWLVGFEAADVVGHEITLGRDEWLADPDRAVGMRAVFMDRDRAWATYSRVVERVSEQSVTIADPAQAWLHVASADGQVDVTLPVGHLMEHLVPDDKTAAAQAGWRDCEATAELLWLASISDDEEADAVSDAIGDLNDDEVTMHVTGPAVGVPDQQPDQQPGA